MPHIFRLPYTIALYDTDAAGIIFYANLFRICQHALEALLADIGYSLPTLFERRTMGMPIVHAEGDFERPDERRKRIRLKGQIADAERPGRRQH